MVNVLITGITGFIGSHLAAALVERGFRVYGTMRHCAARDLRPISEILDDIVLLTADVTNYRSLSVALETSDPDIVCHLAALTPVRYSFEHPLQYEQTNFLGTMNIVHAMMELPDFKKRSLIAASTAEVYGVQPKERPLSEDLPLHPSSPYAVSKAAADMYLRMASEVYDVQCIILRPSNTYGRRFETGFIIEYLIKSMLENKKVYVGAPNSVRDYIHVQDHVAAYLLAVEHRLREGEVYNVGSGAGIRNKELAYKVARLTGYDESRISLGQYPPGYPIRPLISDQPYLVLNSRKIRERGWKPKWSLSYGLRQAIDYWRQGTKTYG